MLKIRNILLINIVAILLLLHSIVPHRHHEEMTCAEHTIAHDNAKGVIDYLGLGFHETPNHNLENAISQSTDFTKNFDSLSIGFQVNFGFANCVILASEINPFVRTFLQKDYLDFIIPSNGLRAPPTNVFYLS